MATIRYPILGAWIAIGMVPGLIALEVKLEVRGDTKLARESSPVTAGIPFARGAVRDLNRLRVEAKGVPVPAQFLQLAPWDDGSVRWALMDIQTAVAASEKSELRLSDRGGNPKPPGPILLEESATEIKISTGPLEVVLDRKSGAFLKSISVDRRPLVTSAGRGLVIVKEDGSEAVSGVPESITVEQSGPLRVLVCIRGRFPGVHKELLSYTVRLSAFAGQKFLKAHIWLENQGAHGFTVNEAQTPNPEWFAFDGMAFELAPDLGNSVTAECEGQKAYQSLKVLQTCDKSLVAVSDLRKPLYTWEDFIYTVTCDGKEAKREDRTEGLVSLKGPTGALTVGIRYFWQEYEKAIEWDGKFVRLWLWPTEGQWPRARVDLRYVGDKNLAAQRRDGLYQLMGGVHKGHEIILDFSA